MHGSYRPGFEQLEAREVPAIGVPVNQPPLLSPIASQTVDESSRISIVTEATDPDLGQSLTFSLIGAPAWASIGSTDGMVTLAPGEGDGPGVYTFRVQATDNGTPALSDQESVSVTVNEVNRAPTLVPIADQDVAEGMTLSFTVSATDNDVPANGLTFSLDAGAPAGAAIGATSGVFTFTPTEAQGPGIYAITVRVADDGAPALSASQTFTVTVREVNQAPVLDPIADQTVTAGQTLSFTVTASDADVPANGLTFSLGVDAPAGASIEPTSGVFTWTPPAGQAPGLYTFTVRVTDDGSPNYSNAKPVAITVLPAASGPVLTVPGPLTVEEGQAISFLVSATDLDGDSLSFSAGELPDGAVFDPATLRFDPSTGTYTQRFSWTPDLTQAGSYEILFVTTDTLGNSASAVMALQVGDKETPKDLKTQNLLDIYFPQVSGIVPENDQYWVGSFTLVNLNDTDGNGKADIFDNSVTVQSARLVKDADQAVFIDIKGADKLFAATVNGAPNRVVIGDANGSEIAYISKVNPDSIQLVDKLKRAYTVAAGAAIYIGELDLMPLVIRLPQGAKEGDSMALKFTGNVRIWQSINKGTEIKLDKNGEVTISIDKDFLATTTRLMYVEATIPTKEGKLPSDQDIVKSLNAQGVRGIVVQARFKDQVDTVRATAVWAVRSNFWNKAKIDPDNNAKTLHGDYDPKGKMADTFKNRFDGDLGMGVFHADGPGEPLSYGGREQQEFTLLPTMVGKEAYVIADMSRQKAGRIYSVRDGLLRQVEQFDFPDKGWNRYEIANDDSNDPPNNPIDEDNSKAKDHVYQIDSPVVTPGPAKPEFLIDRSNFLEFVRFKFGLKQSFVAPNYSVDGSRGSSLEPWHLAVYAKRSTGDFGTASAYAFEGDAIAASTPQFSGKGAEWKVTTPSLKDKSLSEKSDTAGWEATYDAGNDQWSLAMRTWKGGDTEVKNFGPFKKGGDNTWTLTATENKDVLVTFIITPGKTAFAAGDRFTFSTFRSDDQKGSKNEIEVALIDITAEDKQYQRQIKKP
ncbi:MAG: putative Ig domain-containing protein [Gemmataceae bacterium]|nr:putative Ig domain-containing protein [Gemmataceae bacterium]